MINPQERRIGRLEQEKMETIRWVYLAGFLFDSRAGTQKWAFEILS